MGNKAGGSLVLAVVLVFVNCIFVGVGVFCIE